MAFQKGHTVNVGRTPWNKDKKLGKNPNHTKYMEQAWKDGKYDDRGKVYKEGLQDATEIV